MKSKVLEICPGAGLEVNEHFISKGARADHPIFKVGVQCPDCLKFPLRPKGMVGLKYVIPTHGSYISQIKTTKKRQ